LDREATWSADGNTIYFLSDRDGFRGMWARNLNAKTK
jgi:Tol biopolymer transport system component